MALHLAARTLGDGPPLLVLHGLFGSGANWRTIGRRLAESFRVHLVDLRNHGSSPHAATMRYEDMAHDVRTLLDRERIDWATVVGHSMGGKVAMRLALESPERIERLVVVDIAPVDSGRDHGEYVDAMHAVDPGAIASRSDANHLLARFVPDAHVRHFLLQNLERDGDRYRWRINLHAIDDSMDSLTGFPDGPADATCERPTLFVRGEHSDYLTEEHMEAVHRRFPSAHLVTVREAGHWLHAENPSGFLEAVTPFLAHAR